MVGLITQAIGLCTLDLIEIFLFSFSCLANQGFVKSLNIEKKEGIVLLTL